MKGKNKNLEGILIKKLSAIVFEIFLCFFLFVLVGSVNLSIDLSINLLLFSSTIMHLFPSLINGLQSIHIEKARVETNEKNQHKKNFGNNC